MLSDVFHQSYLQKKDKIHHIIEHGTTNSHFLGILRVASLTHKSCCIYYFRYFNIFAWQVSFYLGLLYRDSNLVLAPKNGAHYLFPSEKSRGGNNCPIVFIYLTIKKELVFGSTQSIHSRSHRIQDANGNQIRHKNQNLIIVQNLKQLAFN